VDIYSVIIAIILALSGWVILSSRKATDYKPLTKSARNKKSVNKDEERAQKIILEARNAMKDGDSTRAGQILKRVNAYPNTKGYRSTQSLQQDDTGLFIIASLLMFDSVFEEQLDSNYFGGNDMPMSLQQSSDELCVESNNDSVRDLSFANSGYESSYDSNSSSSFDSGSSSSFDSGSSGSCD
jgi:hypothetical protein